MSFAAGFNIFEAALWFAISAVLFYQRSTDLLRWRFWPLTLPLAFLLFGISDLIEVQTGAWWDPWWLFALMALCVVIFLVHGIQHQRKSRYNKKR